MPTYVENAYELLDKLGQFYLDETAHVLYYIPSRSLKNARSGRAGWENGGEHLGRLADAGRKRAADHPCCHDDDR